MSDWRLPRKEELEEAYDNKISGFDNYCYWSSENNEASNSALYVSFRNKHYCWLTKYTANYVRCIRTASDGKKEWSVRSGDKMDWWKALEYAKGLTTKEIEAVGKWRLPRRSELLEAYKNGTKGFNSEVYWSMTKVKDRDSMWCVYMHNGDDYWYDTSLQFYVRCVRITGDGTLEWHKDSVHMSINEVDEYIASMDRWRFPTTHDLEDAYKANEIELSTLTGYWSCVSTSKKKDAWLFFPDIKDTLFASKEIKYGAYALRTINDKHEWMELTGLMTWNEARNSIDEMNNINKESKTMRLDKKIDFLEDLRGLLAEWDAGISVIPDEDKNYTMFVWNLQGGDEYLRVDVGNVPVISISKLEKGIDKFINQMRPQFDDWRLPSAAEVLSACDKHGAFSGRPIHAERMYWTSDTFSENGRVFWASGVVDIAKQNKKASAVFVRDGKNGLEWSSDTMLSTTQNQAINKAKSLKSTTLKGEKDDTSD